MSTLAFTSLLALTSVAFTLRDNVTCPGDESKCYKIEGCGWTIDKDGWGECKRGDLIGAFGMKKKQLELYVPGKYRGEGSMCLTTVSDDDVRCYEDCMYGEGAKQVMVVPNYEACQAHDTAYTQTGILVNGRKEVLTHVTYKIMSTAIKEGLKARVSPRITRKWIGKQVDKYIIDESLDKIEEELCNQFSEDSYQHYCKKVFSSPIGHYVNHNIKRIPVVEHTRNWIRDSCYEYVPDTYKNGMDDVADAVEEGSWEDTALEVAGYLAEGLFGFL